MPLTTRVLDTASGWPAQGLCLLSVQAPGRWPAVDRAEEKVEWSGARLKSRTPPTPTLQGALHRGQQGWADLAGLFPCRLWEPLLQQTEEF